MAGKFDTELNIIPFFGLVISTFIMFFFSANNISIGFTYALLFLIPTGLLFLGLLLIDENSKKTIIAKLKLPFSTSSHIAAFLFLFGWMSAGLLQFITNTFSNQFSISTFIVPLAAKKTNILLQQTSQQLTILASRAAELYNTVFNASYIEEFVFGFIMIYLMYILIAKTDESLSITNKRKLSHPMTVFFSILVTSILFAVIHSFNSTYVDLSDYVIAGVFRFAMTSMIYFFPFTLSFLLGFHQANNFIWYWLTYGTDALIEAFKSPTGILLGAQFLLLIIIMLQKPKDIQQFWSDFRRNIMRS